MWFRRDLRLRDNAALYHALKSCRKVQAVFIFDTCILGQLEDDNDSRVHFIHHAVSLLHEELVKMGSTLLVLHGDPVKLFAKLRPKAVFANTDYEPYGVGRDERVRARLAASGIPFHTFKDHVIFERNEIVKNDGRPYTVFTPYSTKWKSTLRESDLRAFPVDQHYANLKKTAPAGIPTLADIGFQKSGLSFPTHEINHEQIRKYHQTRDFPSWDGTTKLSVHLRFGTISIRTVARAAYELNGTLLNELIWRDFYHMILSHFPEVDKAFKPAYDRISWRNNEDEFSKWCEGKTGYPIVDAGMRELNATGFMHNRVRMIAASFLTKHLLIDWRWGEAWFARKLLDFDLAANNGGWQWAAGSGCDAAPYFRIFNPMLQAARFDPQQQYIRKWILELNTPVYPKPIVDHAFARQRALNTYAKALR